VKAFMQRGKEDAMKDAEIVELYWRRDETAIAATAQCYGSYCYTIACRILQCSEDAQECVNDTYWKAWQSIPPQRPQRLATYLGKITRNLAIDRLKRQGAQKRGGGQAELALAELESCIPAAAGTEQIVDEIVLAAAVNQFLREQPRSDRNIFVGRYWHLYSIADLAQAYGMRESKVASLLLRMRNKLKRHLEKEGISV
jgi:RNA polymerase sigma-70 factor (ECF subfamily)